MSIKIVSSLILILIFVLPGCSKKEVKPNILLITIDTLRRNHLGFYGYPIETSPFIDELAKKGLVFKNTIAPIPLTAGSHSSILTSLHPLTHQVIKNLTKLNDKFETIAEVLKKNGYYTIGTIASHQMTSRFNFSQGFDSFSDKWDKNIKHNNEFARIAQSVNESLFGQIEDYLKNHKEKPLFIWVHYYDPHTHYINWKNIVLKYKKKKIKVNQYYDKEIRYTDNRLKNYFKYDTDKNDIKNYDKEIRYTDNHIKKLYQYLEKKGLTKKMITCITADHGEQMGEHGHYAAHIDFYSETTFVPLIFHGCKIPENKIVKDYVSTMDIAVTLLGLINVDFEKPVHGVNLLDSKRNPKVTPNIDFLIIGCPQFVRSIQLINTSFSYILNFDFLYKHWFITQETYFPENRLRVVPKKAIHTKYFKKSDEYQININYPYKISKGLYFGVLRFDVKKDSGFSVGYKIFPSRIGTDFMFDLKKSRTVTAYFPVTPLDKLIGYINKKAETEITNLKYTFLSEEEFLKYNKSRKNVKIENKIFKFLSSLRKFKKSDELYNLDTDLKIEKNLFNIKNYPNTIKVVEGKKKIYNFLNFYLEEQRKIIGKSKPGKPLTRKDKEMLKSLGYL